MEVAITAGASDLLKKFKDARAQVVAWRGEAQDRLAKAEKAVSEVLLAAKASKADLYKDFPPLVGARFDLLRKLIKEGGALAAKGKCLRGPMEKILHYRELRVHLCHGIQRLSLDEAGQWVAVFDLIDSDGKASRWTLFEGEATKLKSDLASAVNAVVTNCARMAS